MGLCSSTAKPTGVSAHYIPTGLAHPTDHMEKSKSSTSIGKGGSAKSLKSAKNSFRRSLTETKIQQALLKKKMELAIADKPITFEKILLKFDKLRIVTGYIRDMFNEVAVNGHLDHDGLENTMKKLGVDMQLEEMLDLFDFINVQEQKAISIKEFLVALTVGMVLDAIPSLVTQPSLIVGENDVNNGGGSGGGGNGGERSMSGFRGHKHEVKEMLNLIVSAYLLFDPQGKGYIERSGIEKTLDEHGDKMGGHRHSNPVLSQQRWAEMVSVLLLFSCVVFWFLFGFLCFLF